MAGGSKPKAGSKWAATFQGGTKTSGSVGVTKHGGPGRPSKTEPQGARGAQTQRRGQK